SLAASLERSSEHPLAAAIVASARERGLQVEDVADFSSVTGKGVIGRVGGRTVALGNAAMMRDQDVALGGLEVPADELRREGATALFAAVDGKPGGVIAVADP
ncbi:haloacid dehalogenase, partial [Azospirillum rugosum]